MSRSSFIVEFEKEALAFIKDRMLDCIKQSGIFIFLDNNNYTQKPCRYEALAACGVRHVTDTLPTGTEGQWWFGHICYDYKNRIEKTLSSRHADPVGFADCKWYQPETVLYIEHGTTRLHIEGAHAEHLHEVFSGRRRSRNRERKEQRSSSPVHGWQFRFSKADYLHCIDAIKNHIVQGDCYELNFCAEAFTTSENLDPVELFRVLNSINPSPFAALYRNENAWLICASPERFIHKEKNKITAQPIKGTIRRGENAAIDDDLKQQLFHSGKDRAENVMIVDLMRNDLAKSCKPGSIAAPELFGIYTFPGVHQMISTVTGELRENMTIKDIVENAFPMGSMTGAPKVRVMELIEDYERSRRGIFSGTVGYINPRGDFDFNVVIRSLMYNEATKYLSYQTGGAITYDSIPEEEWKEIKLKAQTMEAALR